MSTRFHIRLDFDIEIDGDTIQVSEWVGSRLIGAGLNTLIDDGVIPAPVKLYDGVYRTVTQVSDASLARRAKKGGAR